MELDDLQLQNELLNAKQKLKELSQEEQEARLVLLLHACMFNPNNDPLDKETRSKMYAEFSMWYAMLILTGKFEE